MQNNDMKKLFENFRRFISESELIESRKSDLIIKHPDLKDDIEFFSDNDPSGKNKYIQWMIKQFAQGGENGREEIVNAVRIFHKNNQRLTKKDLNQYKSLSDLQQTVSAISQKSTQKQKRKKAKETAMKGSEIIYEDSDFFIIRPNTEEASCYYGRNTKWCISATDSKNYFDRYSSEGQTFYFVRSENLQEDDDEKKMAFVINRDGDWEETYNAPDDSISRNKVTNAFARNLFGGVPADTEFEPSEDEYDEAHNKITDLTTEMEEHAKENRPELDWARVEEIESDYNDASEGYISIHADDEGIEETEIYFTGFSTYDLDSLDLVDNFPEIEDAEKDAKNLYAKALDDNHIYPSEITDDFSNGEYIINSHFSPEDSDYTINGFDTFASQMLDYDANFSAAESDFLEMLEDKGYVKPSHYSTTKEKLKSLADSFKHVKISTEDGISISVPMTLNNSPSDQIDYNNVDRNVLKSAYIKSINNLLQKADDFARKQMKLFESMNKIPFDSKDISLQTNSFSSDIIEAELFFAISRKLSKEILEYAVIFAKFLDNNHSKLEEILANLFYKMISKLINKKPEEKEESAPQETRQRKRKVKKITKEQEGEAPAGDINSEIEEWIQLQEEIKVFKKKMLVLSAKSAKLEKKILPVIQEMEDQKVIVKDSIVEYKTSTSNRPSWKTAFSIALEKVNKNTRKILEDIPKQTIDPKTKEFLKLKEGILGYLKSFFSSIWKNLTVSRKSVDQLQKIASMGQQENRMNEQKEKKFNFKDALTDNLEKSKKKQLNEFFEPPQKEAKSIEDIKDIFKKKLGK